MRVPRSATSITFKHGIVALLWVAVLCLLLSTALPHHHSLTYGQSNNDECSLCQLCLSCLVDLPSPVALPHVDTHVRVEPLVALSVTTKLCLLDRLRAPPA